VNKKESPGTSREGSLKGKMQGGKARRKEGGSMRGIWRRGSEGKEKMKAR